MRPTPHYAAGILAAVLVAPALTGCGAATSSAPAPTVTVTATVTATPEPAPTPEPVAIPRSYDDPVGELDAWSLCWGAIAGSSSGMWTLEPYEEEVPLRGQSVQDNGDGSFDVAVVYYPISGEGWAGEAYCTAGGTVGDPWVELQGGADYG